MYMAICLRKKKNNKLQVAQVGQHVFLYMFRSNCENVVTINKIGVLFNPETQKLQYTMANDAVRLTCPVLY